MHLQPGAFLKSHYRIDALIGGGVTITAGTAFISPIWYNDRTEELVYPLDIPAGCQ